MNSSNNEITSKEKIAIIDLGSNSSRMTIWQTEGNKVESIYNKRLYVRLSEGLAEDNLLKEEPKKRTSLQGLLDSAKKLKK